MRKLIASACMCAALVLPAGVARADEGARAGVTRCPGGFYVWYYDLQNQKQILLSTCIVP